MLRKEVVQSLVGNSWAPHLQKFFDTEEARRMVKIIAKERKLHSVFPESSDVFRAFRETPYSKVNVVIVGQDPYHTPGVADGLAFSVKPGYDKIPPSLKNILKELEYDLGYPPDNPITDLSNWAKQGVLLLNTALTVREGEAGSHFDIWKGFTAFALRAISQRFHPTIFVAWGKHAYDQIVNNGYESGFHYLIHSPHPSPFSANKGFFESKPFTRINEILDQMDIPMIDWYKQE